MRKGTVPIVCQLQYFTRRFLYGLLRTIIVYETLLLPGYGGMDIQRF
jgi:hypothetical protein